MKKEKTKVYIYTRVSTAMQIDGYSLDAQKSRMKAFAEFNDYEIVGEYEDAGKSGKSIEGRIEYDGGYKIRERWRIFRSGIQAVPFRKKCGRCIVHLAGHAGFWRQSDLRGGWH